MKEPCLEPCPAHLCIEMTKVGMCRHEVATLRADRSSLAALLASTQAERDALRLEREQLGPVLPLAQQLYAKKNLTPEVVAGYEMLQTAITVLMLSADHVDAIKNYVEIAVVGVLAPFDRAAVHLIRPGGRTPHELRTEAEAQRDSALARAEALETRQQELLVTIRNLSSSVPYAEESQNAATLIAEVGTLKARLRNVEAQRNEAQVGLAHFAESRTAIAIDMASKLADMTALRDQAAAAERGLRAMDIEALTDEEWSGLQWVRDACLDGPREGMSELRLGALTAIERLLTTHSQEPRLAGEEET